MGGGGGGGGGFRPPPAQVEQPTNDPHYVLNGSILSYVDPNDPRMTAPVAAPKPFDVLGKKFITDPITQQSSPFVPPTNTMKVGNDLVAVTQQPDTTDAMGNVFHGNTKVDKLYEGGTPPRDTTRITVPDTSVMSEDEKRLAGIYNPGFDAPKVSGSPAGVSNYFHNARSPFPTPQAQEVVRLTKDGRKAVFDANTKQFLRYAE